MVLRRSASATTGRTGHAVRTVSRLLIPSEREFLTRVIVVDGHQPLETEPLSRQGVASLVLKVSALVSGVDDDDSDLARASQLVCENAVIAISHPVVVADRNDLGWR
jgi:hypothetical protein